MGTYKLNVDGALFPEIHRAGVGFILRDWKRNALLAASINEYDVEDPATIESLAILRGLQHCLYQGIPTLTMESDYQLVVQEVLQAGTPSSEVSNLLLDLRATMSHFTSCNIQYGNQVGNVVTHQLAQHACNVHHTVMWDREMPEFNAQAIWFDKKFV